jgi:hypothetical protein
MSETSSDPSMPDMPRDAERSRGRYVHLRDGKPTGMEERFVLGEIAPGVVRIRSTLITPSPVGKLETDVRRSPGSTDLSVRWVGASDTAVRDADAHYTSADGVVTGSWRVDGQEHPEATATGILDPTSLIMKGIYVATGREGVALVMPDAADPADPRRFLSLLAVTATSTVIGELGVEVDGVLRQGISYRWDVSGVGPDVVVDSGGLLLNQIIETPDGTVYEARLADVTGPWARPLDWPV